MTTASRNLKVFRSLILVPALVLLASQLYTLANGFRSPEKNIEHIIELQEPQQASSVALSTPEYSNEEIIAWSENALMLVMNINQKNYKTQLRLGSQYFTKEGWKNFAAALGKANVFKHLSSQGNSIGAQILTKLAPPSVKIIEGNPLKEWHVIIPTEFSYTMKDTPFKQNVLTFLVIKESSEAQNQKDLIGITQLISLPMKKELKNAELGGGLGEVDE